MDIGLEVETQEHSNWCWAAVSVSVHRFFERGSDARQCGAAGAIRGLPCCDGFTQKCNQPESLTQALTHFGKLKRQPVERAATFDEIRSEVLAGRPLCMRVEWTTGAIKGNGHFAVITGFDNSAGTPVVLVEDPFYGRSRRPYDRIVVSYQFNRGLWTHTYFTGAPK